LATQVSAEQPSPADRTYRALAHRNFEICRRTERGENLSTIAASFGISRQRAHQIALGYLGRERVAGARALRSRLTAQRAHERKLSEVVPCAVCLKPLRRTPGAQRRAHGGECAKLRIAALYVLSEARRTEQQRRIAEWRLRNPESATPAQIRYSERVVAGEQIKSNGRWFIEGSKVHKAWLRILELREGRTA
jgi:hypothetical protein